MYIPDFQLHKPSTLDQAGALLKQYGLDARLLAGGTDLLVDLKTGRVVADHVVSLHGIDSLCGVTKDGGVLRGAVDSAIVAPGEATPRIQEMHLTLIHVLCELLEARRLGGGDDD